MYVCMCVCVVRQRSSFWSSMLKNGLPIRWTWVGESWQMPAKNCTFSTESAHTSTMHGNTVITIKRIIFYLLHSHSHSLSPCLSICLSAFSSFFFTFPFHFFASFSSFPFNSSSISFPYRYLYFAYTAVYVSIHSIARSLFLYVCTTFVTFQYLADSYRMGTNSVFNWKKNYPFQQLNLKPWYAPNWAKKRSQPN